MGQFDDERLPFQGIRAEVATAVKKSVRALMLEVANDQMLHAEVLAAGQFTFRAAFLKDMGPAYGNSRAQCGALADIVFRFFEKYWQKKYPKITPQFFLNKVEVKSPPTQAEIDNDWTVEIASDERAMQSMYEGSARTRKGPLHTHGLKTKMEKIH